MAKTAIIVAGGTGSRSGSKMPKQFVKLLGIPMLWWSVRCFYRQDHDTRIVIVVHPDYVGTWSELHNALPESDRQIPVTVTTGGATRADSVRNGLCAADIADTDLVAVHDGARPLINVSMVTDGFETAAKWSNAIPATPMTDSIRQIGHAAGAGTSDMTSDDNRSCTSKAVDRSEYVLIQTPQIMTGKTIREAYSLNDDSRFTDEASRLDALGIGVRLYDGLPENIKVTNPTDFMVAEVLLRNFNR